MGMKGEQMQRRHMYSPCNMCVRLYLVIYLYIWSISHTHAPAVVVDKSGEQLGGRGPCPCLNPPSPLPPHRAPPAAFKPEVGRRRCVDYSGVACSAPTPVPFKSPPTSPHPTQDVFSVTVSSSPSGHIPDIWTAAGSPQVRQSERAREE